MNREHRNQYRCLLTICNMLLCLLETHIQNTFLKNNKSNFFYHEVSWYHRDTVSTSMFMVFKITTLKSSQIRAPLQFVRVHRKYT